MSDLVTVDRFVFAAEAEMARATLEAAGIDSVLVQDSSKPTEPVILRVHEDDLDAAREVLQFDAEIEADDVPALENEEHCRRCFSIEIYPAESRGKTFARIWIYAALAMLAVRLAMWAEHLRGHDLSNRVDSIAFALISIFACFALLYATVAPKKHCRNCGLEWRGTQRPS